MPSLILGCSQRDCFGQRKSVTAFKVGKCLGLSSWLATPGSEHCSRRMTRRSLGAAPFLRREYFVTVFSYQAQNSLTLIPNSSSFYLLSSESGIDIGLERSMRMLQTNSIDDLP
ncbi:MAG: hypothetical protein ACREJU_11285, partial [Nitrospiraceae bacterium]